MGGGSTTDESNLETEHYMTTHSESLPLVAFSEELLTQMCDFNTNKYHFIPLRDPFFPLREMVGTESPEHARIKPDRQHVIGCFLRLHCHNNHANVPECASDPTSTNLRGTTLLHISTSLKVMKTDILKRSVIRTLK